jgi:hypothetical protein
MQPAPDTADLIATARAALEAEVLPHLPPDHRYPALMVLNALGIAARQIEGAAARRALAAAALAPYGADEAELARALRAGSPRDAALHAALMAVARAETEESNPRARILGALDAQAAKGSTG